MKKIVISGSASLQKQVAYWKRKFEKEGSIVVDYPVFIAVESFLEDYPKVHKNFYQNITKADVLFIMNEDKNNVEGYIGASTFAELAFGVVQNVLHNQNLQIIILKQPSQDIQSIDEIELWLKLGWISLLANSDIIKSSIIQV